MIQKSYNGKPTLYLIPTPIGNMDDLTLRAKKTLEEVDYLLCEDTRITSQLLFSLGIKKKLVSCHDHNEDKIKNKIVEDLNNGLNIGLVTDRGTPIVSDPGYKIVHYVVNNGHNVVSLPGATALIPALTSSGINSEHFLFYGFLNSKKSKREKELDLLNRLPYTVIFYESPHRIKETLQSIFFVLGNRKIAISREISKLYEEVIRGYLVDVLELNFELRGEFVIVVEGNLITEKYEDISLLEHINLYLDDGISEMEAIKKVSKERVLPKSVVYKEYHDKKVN
ncbi:MAG: 16S rRNA (cytidine(1402)-2'-O)-methyltransferase [Bacilli bacterium]|nr:16S rRNA (cytidine(1402)-2'-O)-methyltransferase [Bacilli bacterium]